ncbi:MAG: class I SAM-dependent methyltransferase [Sedimentisphaerales bacterium]|nr:class I SAM-dependent methyltransferase [Sedimentisphaerales bacterium]
MKHEKTQKIGNVLVRNIREINADAPVYCDGEQEKVLYDNFVKDRNYENNCNDTKFLSWVEQYHLSPVRHNLLKWFPFNPEGSALEIGAGCGALTGVLTQKLKKVTSLEYSEQRAMITALRHQNNSNLEVVIGGLQDYNTEEKFDYITVIGVFEYAGKFYEGSDPYKSFLDKIKSFLKPDGVLLLAIENKIGVKYLCGAKEDHTEKVYDSVYNYPYSIGVRTFSKKELSEVLNASGFINLEWYYPWPDYKLPKQVISDDTLPDDINLLWDLFPNGSSVKNLMSEKRLAKTLNDAGLLSEFANSFLVIASSQEISSESKCVHFIGSSMKKKSHYRTNKKIYRNGNKLQFIVSPDNEKAVEYIKLIAERELSAKNFFSENAEVINGELNGNSLVYPYIAIPSITEMMAAQINNGDAEFGKYWIERYVDFLSGLSSQKCVPQEFLKELELPEHEIQESVCSINCGILDCVPRNIMIDADKNKYYIIDNEFTYDFPVPIDFLIWSAINTLVTELQDVIQPKVSQSRPVTIFSGHGNNRYYIPLSWLSILDNLVVPRKKLVKLYSAWQSKILSGTTRVNIRLNDKKNAIHKVTVAEIAPKNQMGENLYRILHKVRRLF